MSELTEEQIKLKAFGRIKAGETLSNLVSELGVAYPKLLRWRKELRKAEDEGKVMELFNLDQVVLDEALDHVKQELVDMASSPEDIKTIEGTVESTAQGVAGLQLLNTELQGTALHLAKRISGLAHSSNLEAKDIQMLTNALAQLQTAFFNKQGTQIAILNQGGESHPLGDFKNLMGD